jgi:micrococcal nuclease
MSDKGHLWHVYGRKTPMFSWEGREFEARLVACHDGDTCRVVFRVDDHSYKQFILRLEGIDTPEVNSKDPAEKQAAHAAKSRLLSLVAPQVFDERLSYTDKQVVEKLEHQVVLVHVKTGAFDKFGRLLAKVYTVPYDPQNKSLNEVLVEEGYAHRYDGGHKAVWLLD